MYALIMAGGSGTRLWPKSRETSPKQLQKLITTNSMFTETVNRVSKAIDPHKIFVVTNKKYVHKLKAQSPEIPQDNIIIEPYPLGTALGIALGARKIYALDPAATIAVLWSDAHIENEASFISALNLAKEAATECDTVIIGVKPTFASTEYGYLKMGNELPKFGPLNIFTVSEYIEKPNKEKAAEYLKKWGYLWNSGMSVWQIEKFFTLFKKHLPDHALALERVAATFNTPDEEKTTAKEFKDLEKIPVDYALYEKLSNICVTPADMGWSDVGTWQTLMDVLPKDQSGNTIRGKHVGLDTTGSLVFTGERLITTIGIRDLIIVDTDDAILVCHKEAASKVKELTQELKKLNKKEYL